jgi:ribosome-associated protein
LRKPKTGATPIITPSAAPSPTWLIATRAAEAKKAAALRVLDLREITTFTDYFVICNGSNIRQNQAIWDEVALSMKKLAGETPASVEGYENGEWILGDYGDVIVHIFSEEKRAFYQLERLWKEAKDVPIPPETEA